MGGVILKPVGHTSGASEIQLHATYQGQDVTPVFTTDSDIASVSESGLLTFSEAGTVTVTAEYNGTTDSQTYTYDPESPTKDISSSFTWTDSYAIVAAVENDNYGNKYYNSSYAGQFCASDYVDVSEFSKIAITVLMRASAGATLGLCFYSEMASSSVISGLYYPNTYNGCELKEIEIPSGANYIRTTFWIANKDEFSCVGTYK